MLEAMAAGCPVLACEDSLPSALEAAALTFKARDGDGLRRLLERMLTDQGTRERSVNLGREAAERLTWDGVRKPRPTSIERCWNKSGICPSDEAASGPYTAVAAAIGCHGQACPERRRRAADRDRY